MTPDLSSSLILFHKGYDTVDLARHFGITEAEAERALRKARDHFRSDRSNIINLTTYSTPVATSDCGVKILFGEPEMEFSETGAKRCQEAISVPAGLLRKLAGRIIQEGGHHERDIFGSRKSRLPFAVQCRWKIIRAAHEAWPSASLSSIARVLGVDHNTVRNVVGSRRNASSGRNAGGRQ